MYKPAEAGIINVANQYPFLVTGGDNPIITYKSDGADRSLRIADFQDVTFAAEEAQEIRRNDALVITNALNNPFVAGIYEPQEYINLVGRLAQSESIDPNIRYLEPNYLRIVTAFGGHTEPSIMFNSYRLAGIHATHQLDQWSNEIKSRVYVPRAISVENILFLAYNAAISVNHDQNPARQKAVAITAEVNQLMARYYDEAEILDYSNQYNFETDKPWESEPWAAELHAVCTPILQDLLSYEDNSDVGRKDARDALMALINRGGNHGDGKDVGKSFEYIAMHLIYFSDINLPGVNEGLVDTINYTKRDERLFRKVRKYLAERLIESGSLGITKGAVIADLRTKVNYARAAYYPEEGLPIFGTWGENKEVIYEYLTNPDSFGSEVGRKDATKKRWYDVNAMLGLTLLPGDITETSMAKYRDEKARAFIENVLVKIEQDSPELVAKYLEAITDAY